MSRTCFSPGRCADSGRLPFGSTHPHLTYHVSHFHEMATVDAVGNALSLGGAVVLALVVLIAGWRPLVVSGSR